MIVSGVSLLVTLGADIVLIPAFGILGAAAASSMSYTVALLIATALMRRATGLTSVDLLIPRPAEVAAMAGGSGTGLRAGLAARPD